MLRKADDRRTVRVALSLAAAAGLTATLGVVASFLGLIVTLCVFAIQQRRLEKVRKQEIYQRLELASNDLFRFTAGNAPVLAAYGSMEKDPGFEPTAADSMVADNHIFQTLNLFEMAARLRHALDELADALAREPALA